MPDTLPSHRFCVAPMMDWTDRHCRYFLRLLSRHALLYTEMVTTGALLHGDWRRHLQHDPAELPLALQLGGSNPDELARCAVMAEESGFSEVNLNVGCPSDRVQNNRIGACLMADATLVADCVASMRAAVRCPVTVKCRIGIDAMDSDEAFFDFVDTVAAAGGCRTFIVHARIALLQGLSPKENREIPPLNYGRVHRLKQRRPALEIVINGGLTDLQHCSQQLQSVDGVMLGRAAYHNPWLLAAVDQQLFDAAPTVAARQQVVAKMLPYVEARLQDGVPLNHMTRHMLGLFHEQPGGKRFRRHLSENAHRAGAGLQVLLDAVSLVGQRERSDAAPASA